MGDTRLLEVALSIVPPQAETCGDLDVAAGQLDMYIDFSANSRFACPSCGATDGPAFDANV